MIRIPLSAPTVGDGPPPKLVVVVVVAVAGVAMVVVVVVVEVAVVVVVAVGWVQRSRGRSRLAKQETADGDDGDAVENRGNFSKRRTQGVDDGGWGRFLGFSVGDDDDGDDHDHDEGSRPTNHASIPPDGPADATTGSGVESPLHIGHSHSPSGTRSRRGVRQCKCTPCTGSVEVGVSHKSRQAASSPVPHRKQTISHNGGVPRTAK
jgi:hypothetical protein